MEWLSQIVLWKEWKVAGTQGIIPGETNGLGIPRLLDAFLWIVDLQDVSSIVLETIFSFKSRNYLQFQK